MRRLGYYIIFLLWPMPLFAAGSGGSAKCGDRISPSHRAIEVLEASCHAIKNSDSCKNFYAELDKNFENASEADARKLKCERSELERQQSWSNWDEILMACAAGAIVDPIVDLADQVVKGVSNARIKWNEARECDQNLDQKRAYVNAYNLDRPTLMRVPEIPTEKLKRMTCNQVQVHLMNHQSTQFNALSNKLSAKELSPTGRKQLSEEEKEFLAYRKNRLNGRPGEKGSGLMAMVNNALEQYNVRIECYPPEYAARLRCEMASLVASVGIPSLFAVRAAKLAKLSGLKVDNFVEKSLNAERNLAGKLTNESQKAEILGLASQLTNRERVAAFEKLVGRKLSDEEARQLIKMHEVGMAEGRGFSTYTYSDYKNKVALGRKVNPQTGKPFFTDDEINTAMRTGITGTKPDMSVYERYAKLARENPDKSAYQRLHAETASAHGKTSEAQAAYNKAYESFLKEKKINTTNSQDLNRRLGSLSERELFELENFSAHSQNTSLVKPAIEKRFKIVEEQIRREYSGRPGGSDAFNQYIQDYHQGLRREAQSSQPLIRKAAEEKIKALRQVFPGIH